MKILRSYLKIPPLEGGMEKHIGLLTACQRDSGEEVDLLFNRGTATGPGDIQVWPTGDLFQLRPQVAAVTAFYILSLFAFRRQRRRYDILHLHGDWSALLLAGALKKACHAKVLAFSFHGGLTTRRPHTHWLPYLLQKTDIIFSTGYRSAQILQASSGRPVIFQPSGVAENFFISAKQSEHVRHRFTALTIARLVGKKNLGLVLDIAVGLPEVDFLIVGDGTQYTFLSDRVARERIGTSCCSGANHRQKYGKSWLPWIVSC